MKKILLLFLCLLLLAASCATQKNLTSDPSPEARGETPPLSEGDGGRLYYNGNDESSASSGVVLYQTNNKNN
jgi:hypothetical protein